MLKKNWNVTIRLFTNSQNVWLLGFSNRFVQANWNDSFEGPTKMSTLPNIEFDRRPFLPNTMNCQTNLKGESVYNRSDNCVTFREIYWGCYYVPFEY